MTWLDPRQWILVLAFCAASVLGYHFWSARLIAQGDAAGYARAVAKYQAAAEKARAEGEARTLALQNSFDKARQEKAHAIFDLQRRHAADIERLRNRPERPASRPDLPATAGAGPAAASCTGSDLFRQDAEFLVREAARADLIRAELASCYADYERARAMTNAPPQDAKAIQQVAE